MNERRTFLDRAALPAYARRTRARIWAVALTVAFSYAWGRRARAQDDFAELAPAQDPSHERYRTPQLYGLELQLGPYYPNVDKEFPGDPAHGPHHQYFGSKKRLMPKLGFEVQFLRSAGTLAVGASVGYLKENANAFVEPATGAIADVRSADTTGLTVIPTALSLTYRFDVFAKRWHIPLVPFARGGLDYAFWSISNSNGDVAQAAGGRGRGGTWGWHAATGLALMLDWLDPGAAQEFDAETGVNHTYLYGEIAHTALDGLGRSDVLHLGANTWAIGLLLEF